MPGGIFGGNEFDESMMRKGTPMTVIALDIGTTKICAIAVDAPSGRVLEVLSQNNTFLPAPKPWERIQDVSAICTLIQSFCDALIPKYSPILCIGITGQMHGILYLNSKGEAISPLYTWQDESGLLPYKDGLSYSQYLTHSSGYPMASGYGITTLFCHTLSGAIPAGTSAICTIQDYVAMRLTGRTRPLVHTTNAASFGCFSLASGAFDVRAIQKAGMDAGLLPEITEDIRILGETKEGIPVAVAIGDNQASFLGAVNAPEESVLVNIGTGSQVSFLARGSEKPLPKGLELRPYFEGRYLYAGSPLCGGSAYALLERFFRSVVSMAGIEAPQSLYDKMDELLRRTQEDHHPLKVYTQFSGTREQPQARGRIENISYDNFTPENLIRGFLNGMAQELYALVEPMQIQSSTDFLIASGNGVRKNLTLRQILSQRFQAPVKIPRHREEAAFGAALYAMTGVGFYISLKNAGALIQYEGDE